MIKGVIFDVDGVLLDSMSAWENLGQMYLKHLGISAEADLGEILSPMAVIALMANTPFAVIVLISA